MKAIKKQKWVHTKKSTGVTEEVKKLISPKSMNKKRHSHVMTSSFNLAFNFYYQQYADLID